ncbi:MAG: S9 family peptidase [Ignavibacteriaceae bacterium]
MKTKITSRYLIVISLFLLSAVYAQNKKPLTMEDQLKFDIPSLPLISPNEDKIIFTERKADLNSSKWITQIYLFNVKSKSYHQFSENGESSTAPQFSPDEKWITFISKRPYLNKETGKMENEAAQLWAAPLSGGEALNWTSLPESVDEYAWSNDSKKIALLSDEFDAKADSLKEALAKKKIDGEVFPHKNPSKVLSILNVEIGKIESSFILDPGVSNISFNSAGDRIVYQTNYTGDYDDAQKYDIYSIDLSGKKTQLTSEAGPETSPAFSDDGKKIAYITQTVPDVEFAETDLNIMNADGSSKENLTANFNYSVDNFVWKDNSTILFTVKERTNTQLYQINLQTKEIKPLTSGNTVISNLSVSKGGNNYCYLFQNAESLPEIYFDGKKLTDFSHQLENFDYGTQEVVTYKSRDGKFDIDGIIFKPKNFDPNKKYPLILTVHGGPYGRFTNTFDQIYGIRDFNSNGYLVFAPNPRGSSGYSDEFGESARYDLGGGDYRDVMDGVNYIISKGFIDTTRMGVTGGSYGGYLTNWIISQTNRFKAAVSMYGLYSLITDFSNSWQPSFEKMWLGYYYWEKPIDMNNLYISRSPAFYSQNIETPTLILHGAIDVYTDVSNSREMYQALHTRGVPVKFVIYPREGHGLRNEPNHYLDVIHRSVGWFNQYFGNPSPREK